MLRQHVIAIHSQAPAKPAPGRPCNGCGVCCSWQPCPAGMLISRRRTGACSALLWRAAGQRYHCGLITAPQQFVPALPGWMQPMFAALLRRWISAGSGCDSTIELTAAGRDA